jgi:hypothetical protein
VNAINSHASTDRLPLATGIIGIIIMVLFAVSNFALGGVDPPKPEASAQEVANFFVDHAGNEEWGVGMRFIVFLLLAPFLLGLARHVRGDDALTGALAALAVIGAVWLLTTGTVANTFESILVYERANLAAEPELARLLNIAMNALYSIAILPHALVIGCLSYAGLRTRVFPVWLVAIGCFQVVTGLIGGVTLAQGLKWNTFTDLTFGLSFFAFALWYLLASLVMVVAGTKADWRRLS